MRGATLVEVPAYLGIDRKTFKAILRTDCCNYCGGSGGTVDHVHPRSHGGLSRPENLVGACYACNSEKDTRSLLLYLLARARGC